MNYVFLDIDQVLNNNDSIRAYTDFFDEKITKEELFNKLIIMPNKFIPQYVINGHHVLPELLDNLKILTNQYHENIVIVGISSWFELYNAEEIAEYLNLPIIDVVDSLVGGAINRENAILRWFKSNQIDYKNAKFVIFDDDHKGKTLKEFIPVDGKIGLTLANIKSAEEIFDE